MITSHERNYLAVQHESGLGPANPAIPDICKLSPGPVGGGPARRRRKKKRSVRGEFYDVFLRSEL